MAYLGYFKSRKRDIGTERESEGQIKTKSEKSEKEIE